MSSSYELVVPLAALVVALFLLGALVISIGGRRAGPPGPARLWTVYVTELGIVAAILVPAYFGPWALLPVVLGIGLTGARELYGVLRGVGLGAHVRLGLLGGACLYIAAVVAGESLAFAALAGIALLTLAAGVSRPGGMRQAIGTLFALVYPGTFLVHLLLISKLDGGFGYVVFLFGLIEIGDSAALLAGTLIGGRRLWPRISPSKTVVGSVAGLGATLIGSILLGFAVPAFSVSQIVAGGALVGVLGQAGDLVASAIKREAGVKDFSSLVSVQGGVLDIYDGLIFTAPAFYYFVRMAA